MVLRSRVSSGEVTIHDCFSRCIISGSQQDHRKREWEGTRTDQKSSNPCSIRQDVILSEEVNGIHPPPAGLKADWQERAINKKKVRRKWVQLKESLVNHPIPDVGLAFESKTRRKIVLQRGRLILKARTGIEYFLFLSGKSGLVEGQERSSRVRILVSSLRRWRRLLLARGRSNHRNCNRQGVNESGGGIKNSF